MYYKILGGGDDPKPKQSIAAGVAGGVIALGVGALASSCTNPVVSVVGEREWEPYTIDTGLYGFGEEGRKADATPESSTSFSVVTKYSNPAAGIFTGWVLRLSRYYQKNNDSNTITLRYELPTDMDIKEFTITLGDKDSGPDKDAELGKTRPKATDYVSDHTIDVYLGLDQSDLAACGIELDTAANTITIKLDQLTARLDNVSTGEKYTTITDVVNNGAVTFTVGPKIGDDKDWAYVNLYQEIPRTIGSAMDGYFSYLTNIAGNYKFKFSQGGDNPPSLGFSPSEYPGCGGDGQPIPLKYLHEDGLTVSKRDTAAGAAVMTTTTTGITPEGHWRLGFGSNEKDSQIGLDVSAANIALDNTLPNEAWYNSGYIKVRVRKTSGFSLNDFLASTAFGLTVIRNDAYVAGAVNLLDSGMVDTMIDLGYIDDTLNYVDIKVPGFLLCPFDTNLPVNLNSVFFRADKNMEANYEIVSISISPNGSEEKPLSFPAYVNRNAGFYNVGVAVEPGSSAQTGLTLASIKFKGDDVPIEEKEVTFNDKLQMLSSSYSRDPVSYKVHSATGNILDEPL
jgi:hypothetical protein